MLTLNLSTKINSSSLNAKIKSLAPSGLFAFLIFLSLTSCDLISYRVLTKPLVQVENKNLSVQDFSKSLARKLSALDPLSAKDPQIVKKFKNKIVSDFIVDAMIEIWFENSKLTLSSKEIDDEIKKIIAGYPDDKSFREELTIQEISYQEWKKGIELSLKRRALFNKLRSESPEIKDEELKSFYESNKTRFYQNEMLEVKSILLQDENQAEIIKKLSKKNSFESLVKEYSLEKSQSHDGSYGWVERTTGSDFEALFSNKKNELIGPLKFAEGYRLFKVLQRKPSHQRTFEEVREQIRSEISSLRETARFSAWLDEQIKRYRVLKNTAALDSIAVETRAE